MTDRLVNGPNLLLKRVNMFIPINYSEKLRGGKELLNLAYTRRKFTLHTSILELGERILRLLIG